MRLSLIVVMFILFVVACSQQPPLNLAQLPPTDRAALTTVYTEEDLEHRDVTYRDNRLLTMRHTDTQYVMPLYRTRADWERRAGYIRQRILVSAGLFPLPEKTPLNLHISGRIEYEDYAIEKIRFESYSGFYVTGNLYRPRGKKGPFPAILSPHGHWKEGRLVNSERGSVPGRGINFAKQGYVVFAYDMVGYGDSKQVDHTFANDSLSQVWAINLLGLQLWNSIRSLDFIMSLDDVDTNRIVITGASGGGTQTFLLTAIDNRNLIKATAPVNMISAHFQGGSLCENAPGLRHDIFNVEIGAAAAPRPQIMVSNTQDWTVNTPLVEYPLIKGIYSLFGAEDKLSHVQYDYPHNYNQASREAVYAWFGRWILGEDNLETLKEQPFEVDKDEDLLVFPDGIPPGDMDEEKLIRYLQATAKERVRRDWPTDKGELSRFRDVYGIAFEHIISAEFPGKVVWQIVGQSAGPDYRVTRLLISRPGKRDWIPAIWYQPLRPSGEATLILSPKGKAGLVLSGRAEPVQLVTRLLGAGQSVLAIDAFKTGEHVLPPGTTTQRDETFKHFLTFNRSDTQERVQDILTALSFLVQGQGVTSANMIGLEDAGSWAILAGAIARDRLDKVVADGRNIDHTDASQALKVFVPGLSRSGAFTTAIALYAPGNLLLYGTAQGFNQADVQQVYGLAGHPEGLVIHPGQLEDEGLVRYLIY